MKKLRKVIGARLMKKNMARIVTVYREHNRNMLIDTGWYESSYGCVRREREIAARESLHNLYAVVFGLDEYKISR